MLKEGRKEGRMGEKRKGCNKGPTGWKGIKAEMIPFLTLPPFTFLCPFCPSFTSSSTSSFMSCPLFTSFHPSVASFPRIHPSFTSFRKYLPSFLHVFPSLALLYLRGRDCLLPPSVFHFPSFLPAFRPSVRPSVLPSVRPSVLPSFLHLSSLIVLPSPSFPYRTSSRPLSSFIPSFRPAFFLPSSTFLP